MGKKQAGRNIPNTSIGINGFIYGLFWFSPLTLFVRWLRMPKSLIRIVRS